MTRWMRWVAGMACAAGAAGATGTSTAAPPMPSWVAAFVRQHGLTRYRVAMADLNGDGRAEALVYAIATDSGGGSADLCGSGGCDLFVVSRTPDGRRQVAAVSPARLPVRILRTRSHGWRDLGVEVAGGGIVRGYEARLRFDGAHYPANPTVPPAMPVPAGGHAPGAVAIAVGP